MIADKETFESELANVEDQFLEDYEKDRILNDYFDLVGRKFQVVYINGSFVGIYYNLTLL